MEKQNSGFMNKFQAVLEKYVVPVALISGPVTVNPTNANEPKAINNIIDINLPIECVIDFLILFHSFLLCIFITYHSICSTGNGLEFISTLSAVPFLK